MLFFAFPIAYYAMLYVPFYNVEPRYSLPAFPFVYLFAAYLVARRKPGEFPKFAAE